jgi:hypothetical protein
MARPHRIVPGPGRPCLYTEEIGYEICARLAQGELLLHICREPHLPSEAAVRSWVVENKFPDFTRLYQRAREHQAHRWFEEIIEISDQSAEASTMSEVASYQLRANSRNWACAKALPHEFGDRVITLDNRQQVVHVYLPKKDEIDPDTGQLLLEGGAQLVDEPGSS